MTSIQEQLKEVINKHERLNKVRKHVEQLKSQINGEQKTLQKLSRTVDQEQAEYERMEKLSLKSVFHKVLGNEEEQIEKERQEYLQAFLRYNEAKKSIEILEFEQSTLSGRLEEFPAVEADFHRLLQAREAELLKQDPSIAAKIRSIYKKKDAKQRMLVEVEEAITSGEKALHTLNQMIAYLNKARNWGQYDMANRGPMPGMMKHSSIDKARSVSYQVKVNLQSFADELRDVYGENFNFPFKIESFSGFMDMFFDNLISDWIIQSKIKNSLSNCLSVRDKVMRLISSLKAEVPAIDSEIAALENNRNDIIIKS